VVDKIEGEKASPENKTKELGYCYLRAYKLALKLTIPP